MNLKIYSISKKDNDEYENIVNNFIKMSKRWATIENINIMNKYIIKAQNSSEIESKRSYKKEFDKYLGSYNIVLDPSSKEMNSEEFSYLLKDRMHINFFIGGAYGFESSFLNSCQKSIGLSQLTLSHKVAKVVLFEQIYRALSLINNHPYHKL